MCGREHLLFEPDLFDDEDDDEMPRLNPRSRSVDKPGYPPRSSRTESITSFTTASTSGKKRNIAAVSDGWPAFQSNRLDMSLGNGYYFIL